MKIKQVRAVLFDWDGTLVDSLEVKIHNAGRLFQQTFNLDPGLVEKAYRVHSGIPRRELFDAILSDLGQPLPDDTLYDSLSRSFSEMNRSALQDSSILGLVPAATPRILAFLQQAGCRLFVSSSADTHEIRDIAVALGLSDYFSRSGGEILGSKPGFSKGSQHVDYICEKYSLKRDEMIFVGDDPADIRLGKAAGLFTVARAGTQPADKLRVFGPDVIVDSLDELTRLPGLKFGASVP